VIYLSLIIQRLRENSLRFVFYCAVIFHFLVYWGGLSYLGIFSYLGGIDFVRGYVVYENIRVDLSTMYDTPFTLMYLPSAAIFIYLLYFLLAPFMSDLLLSVSLLALGMFVLNLLICWLIKEIAIHFSSDQRSSSRLTANPYLLMTIYILIPVHTIEYHIGQFNTLACFFLVLGIYCIVKKKESLGLLMISTGVVIKVVLALFLIFLLLSKASPRTFFKRLLWAFLPHVISLIMIVAIPKLLFDFLNQIQISINVIPPKFNMPANIVDFLRYNEFANSSVIVIISIIILAINFYLFYTYKKGMNMLDQFFFISILLVNMSPILYITHIKIYLPIILLWLGASKGDTMASSPSIKLEKAIKVILLIPTVSYAVWMYYPYLFIIFLGVMVGNFALSAYKYKFWLSMTPVANRSTVQNSK
jgi:hypothetical protein